jgi:hypothetical protein
MAKQKKRRHMRFRRKGRRGRDTRIPLLPTIGIGYALYNVLGHHFPDLQAGKIDMYLKGVATDAVASFAGYDINSGQWNWTWLKGGLIPVAAGVLTSKLMTMLGVNRYMRRVPLIGRRVKL